MIILFFSSSKVLACTNDLDCGHGAGVCSTIIDPPSTTTDITSTTTTTSITNICICKDYYSGESCEYRQKSRKMSLILSVLMGWVAMDRMYLEFYWIGIAKGVPFLLFWIGFAIVFINKDRRTELEKQQRTKKVDIHIYVNKEEGKTIVRRTFIPPFSPSSCCGVMMILWVVSSFFLSLTWWIFDWLYLTEGLLAMDGRGIPIYDDL